MVHYIMDLNYVHIELNICLHNKQKMYQNPCNLCFVSTIPFFLGGYKKVKAKTCHQWLS